LLRRPDIHHHFKHALNTALCPNININAKLYFQLFDQLSGLTMRREAVEWRFPIDFHVLSGSNALQPSHELP
jgi:hypothetical protein